MQKGPSLLKRSPQFARHSGNSESAATVWRKTPGWVGTSREPKKLLGMHLHHHQSHLCPLDLLSTSHDVPIKLARKAQ